MFHEILGIIRPAVARHMLAHPKPEEVIYIEVHTVCQQQMLLKELDLQMVGN